MACVSNIGCHNFSIGTMSTLSLIVVITTNILARCTVLYDRLMIETLVINVTLATAAFSLSLRMNFGIDYSRSRY